jgi:hypothetical protein
MGQKEKFGLSDNNIKAFCYDKARELKFGELAVHVYKKTR